MIAKTKNLNDFVFAVRRINQKKISRQRNGTAHYQEEFAWSVLMEGIAAIAMHVATLADLEQSSGTSQIKSADAKHAFQNGVASVGKRK